MPGINLHDYVTREVENQLKKQGRLSAKRKGKRAQKKKSGKGKPLEKKKKSKKQKPTKSNTNQRIETGGGRALNKGPYGFEHPEEIDVNNYEEVVMSLNLFFVVDQV